MNEKTTDHRAAMMQALAVAETITSRCPVQEYDSIDISPQGIRLFAFNRPEDVAAFGETLGLELTFRLRKDQRPYVAAAGDVDGVPVQVWALGDVEERERYAAVVSAQSGLPQEWAAEVSA